MLRSPFPLALLLSSCIEPGDVERPETIDDDLTAISSVRPMPVAPVPEAAAYDLPLWAEHVVPARRDAKSVVDVQEMEAALERETGPAFEFRLRLAHEQLRVAVGELQDGRPFRSRVARAVKLLDELIGERGFDTHPHLDRALIDLCVALLVLGKEQELKDTLLRLIRARPASDWIPFAYLCFADSRLVVDKPTDAVKLYQKIGSFQDPLVAAYAAHGLGTAYTQLDPARRDESLAAHDLAIELTKSVRPADADSASKLADAARMEKQRLIEQVDSEPAGEADGDRRDQ